MATKNICGCIHPHRAPGFENRKPKHRRDDGTYPEVRLLFTERRQCGKALLLSRRIEGEYVEAEKQSLTTRVRHSYPQSRDPGDAVSAYWAHLEDIRRHLAIEDYSRVDAMIALRLRATTIAMMPSWGPYFTVLLKFGKSLLAGTGSAMPSAQRDMLSVWLETLPCKK